jgi:hypothetical protein
MKELIAAVLEIAFAFALLATVAGVAEWIGVLRFSPWAYRIGPIALRQTKWIAIPPADLNEPFGTEKGEFILVEPDVCLFHPKTRWLAILDAFAVAATMTWDGESGEARVEGRAPLATTVFMVFWAIGWIAAGYYVVYTNGDPFVGWGVAASAPIALFGAWYALVPLEARRALRVLDELAEGLAEIGVPSPAPSGTLSESASSDEAADA